MGLCTELQQAKRDLTAAHAELASADLQKETAERHVRPQLSLAEAQAQALPGLLRNALLVKEPGYALSYMLSQLGTAMGHRYRMQDFRKWADWYE